MTNTVWTNGDGLQVRFGQTQARETKSLMAKTWDVGPFCYMQVELVHDDLPTYTADLDNDGTNEAFSDQDAYIPAGSYITRAIIVVTEAFADAGSDGTLTLGLYNQAGSEIDADGIDATIAVGDLGANEAVDCDGQLVGTQDLLTADAYLVSAVANGPFTAGEAKLVIEYIQVAP